MKEPTEHGDNTGDLVMHLRPTIVYWSTSKFSGNSWPNETIEEETSHISSHVQTVSIFTTLNKKFKGSMDKRCNST